LSYGHANKQQAQLEAEVAELLALAEDVDKGDIPDGMDVPHELAVRKDRIQAIKEAKREIERRAAQRYDKERKEYDQKLAERTKKEAPRCFEWVSVVWSSVILVCSRAL